MGVVLAIGASVAWGFSDFLGGLKAKSVPLVLVLLVSQAAGLVVAGIILAIAGEAMPADGRLLLGLLAGVAAVVDLGLIYFVLARGPVVLIAPIAAGGAAIPAIVGLVGGDPVSPAIVAGLILALAGSFAASLEKTDDHDSDGLTLTLLAAVGAALGIGLALILLERASEVDPLWATGALRVGGLVSASILLAIAVGVRHHRAAAGGEVAAPRPGALPVEILAALVVVGVLDVAADVGYSTASTVGDLSTIAVLASLYPVVTVILGYFVLQERVRTVQLAGVALALTGVALLAGAS